VGKAQEEAVLVHVGIKELNHVLDTSGRRGLKEAKCHYNVLLLNLALKTEIV
jgi:hypothetical protein